MVLSRFAIPASVLGGKNSKEKTGRERPKRSRMLTMVARDSSRLRQLGHGAPPKISGASRPEASERVRPAEEPLLRHHLACEANRRRARSPRMSTVIIEGVLAREILDSRG